MKDREIHWNSEGEKKKRHSLLGLPVSTENEEGKGHIFHCQQMELRK